MQIRPERPDDEPGIRQVHLDAFETAMEADLVDALRVQTRPFVSLVADAGGKIVGHILFTPVTVAPPAPLLLMGLAPMAVAPSRQLTGIGTALVRQGLASCRALGCAAVVVLGHPGYYPRFGFVPASAFGLSSEYEVADEAFMALELQPGALQGHAGTVRYHPAFAGL